MKPHCSTNTRRLRSANCWFCGGRTCRSRLKSPMVNADPSSNLATTASSGISGSAGGGPAGCDDDIAPVCAQAAPRHANARKAKVFITRFRLLVQCNMSTRRNTGKLKRAPPISCVPWVGHALACPDHQAGELLHSYVVHPLAAVAQTDSEGVRQRFGGAPGFSDRSSPR